MTANLVTILIYSKLTYLLNLKFEIDDFSFDLTNFGNYNRFLNTERSRMNFNRSELSFENS